jgi:hypothetical protein
LADEQMTTEESRRILEAVRVLEGLEASNRINATEQAALNAYRKKTKTAERAQVETTATYRGALQGATLRTADEINAAIKALGGGSYEEALARARELNMAARVAAPEQYAKGEFAGMGATSVLPFGGTQLATRGLGLLPQIAAGAATGGALASFPDFAGGEGGFMSRMAEVSPITTAIGATLGALAPAAGAAGGAAVRGLQNIKRGLPEFGLGSMATQRAARTLGRSQASGTDIEQYLRDIGELGTIADVPGSPQLMAQGLTAMGGEGGDALARAVTQRAAGAGPRIEQAADVLAGAPNRAFRERVERATERSTIYSPLYEAAKQYPDPIDVRAVTSALVFRGSEAVGDTKKAINSIIRDLSNEKGQVSAEKLHNVRVSISDKIEVARREGAGGVVSNLSPILTEIDRKLDDITGYAAARGGWADTKALDTAAEEGRKVFTGGATTVETPDDFAVRFSKLKDAEKEAFRSGSREYISALMGTSRNAPAAAWSELSKGFTDKKLRIMFGDTEAEEILRTLRAEKVFSETRGKLTAGSQTAMREEAMRELGDIRDPSTMQRPGPVARAWKTFVDNPTNAVIDSILYAGRTGANRDLGRILSMQGPERDRMIAALLREAEAQGRTTGPQRLSSGLLSNIIGSSSATQGYGLLGE